jgi:hypothetical protein
LGSILAIMSVSQTLASISPFTHSSSLRFMTGAPSCVTRSRRFTFIVFGSRKRSTGVPSPITISRELRVSAHPSPE